MNQPLVQVFLIVVGSFLAVAILSRWRVSPIVGYLAVGTILGPHGVGVMSEGEGLRFFGELGVALLMFFIGLEFAWPRILASKGRMIAAGAVAVALTSLIVGVIVQPWLGTSVVASAIIGCAIAISSTAFVLKHLVDMDEISTGHGEASSGIVLFEDLAALVMLAVIGSLRVRNGDSAGFQEPFLRFAIALIIFAVAALFARPILGRALAWIAKSRINETFLLAVLALILGAAVAATSIGLSLPIGAFIVGMIVGESDFRHQFEDEVRPLRDLLLGIFFVGIGMSVDWTSAFVEPLDTVGLLLVIIMVKLVVVTAVASAFGLNIVSALRTGFLLAHSGELGLLIIAQSIGSSLLPVDVGQPVLGAVAISLLVGPFLARIGHRVAPAFTERAGRHDHLESVMESSHELDRHVLMAGCGPVGRLVAVTLEASRIPYLAIERNLELLHRAQEDGHNVIFGDATRPGILKAAGVERASTLVILIHDWMKSARVIREARHLNPDLQIIASVKDDLHMSPLVEAGASHIFPENFAAGLGLAAQALVSTGVPPSDAIDRIRRIRAHLSPELRLLLI